MTKMKTLLALLALSALAAACHERKAEPRPDYEGSRSSSEKAHQSLDNEARGQ